MTTETPELALGSCPHCGEPVEREVMDFVCSAEPAVAVGKTYREADRHKEIMRLMREDFDPTPAGWEGREWNDNAEDVATQIAAIFAPAGEVGLKASTTRLSPLSESRIIK
jgi:hypothetical protein